MTQKSLVLLKVQFKTDFADGDTFIFEGLIQVEFIKKIYSPDVITNNHRFRHIRQKISIQVDSSTWESTD